MFRKRSPLPVQVLLFLLVTMLGIAIGNLNNSPGALPWELEFVRRQSLPLAGIIVLLIIGVMAWQHRADQRSALPARPVWDSDRSPSRTGGVHRAGLGGCSSVVTPRSLSCWTVCIR
ncbi:MAG: hypothetical protein ACRDRX_04800 [Pseudonocardiaceae bacterium]